MRHNKEQVSENSPLVKTDIKAAGFPTDLRVSVLGARLFLGTLTLAGGSTTAIATFQALTSRTPIAEAAPQEQVQATVQAEATRAIATYNNSLTPAQATAQAEAVRLEVASIKTDAAARALPPGSPAQATAQAEAYRANQEFERSSTAFTNSHTPAQATARESAFRASRADHDRILKEATAQAITQAAALRAEQERERGKDREQTHPIATEAASEVNRIWWFGVGAGAAAVFGGALIGAYGLGAHYRKRSGPQVYQTPGNNPNTSASASPNTQPNPNIPSNPNVAPGVCPAKQHSPEWVKGVREFEKRWLSIKPSLPKDYGPDALLEKFTETMNIVHGVILDNSAIPVPPMGIRVRAGIEYLISEIWQDQKMFRDFFVDIIDPDFTLGFPQFNKGSSSPEIALAKTIFFPKNLRELPRLDDLRKKDIGRIRRVLMHGLHPDTAKDDSDPAMKPYMDELLKVINPSWSYVKDLM